MQGGFEPGRARAKRKIQSIFLRVREDDWGACNPSGERSEAARRIYMFSAQNGILPYAE